MEYRNKVNGTLSYPEPPLAADIVSKSCRDEKTRKVGLFYFLWLGEHGRHKPYDVSKILAADADAGYKPNSEVWGGEGVYHHWGEPLFGYYYSDDEWVVRKHMKLLIQSSIDFLFFDTTNAVIYENNAKLVMRILDEYRRDGWEIPKIMFYTNTASGNTVDSIYNSIYRDSYMPETWFIYEGKPLIIANRADCRDEMLEYFTIREAQWPNEADKEGGWPWMDFTKPQRVFTDFEGNDEVINVSAAQHPQLRFGDSAMYGETGNCGRAFHNGRNDSENDGYKMGYNFIEQFERAIEADPPVVLVTGWNEWIAGRWKGIAERPIMFVDCANYEYSRDMEMMRGGYGDSYFRQLISCVRKYKGISDAIKEIKAGEIAEFFSFSDDDTARNHEGYGTVYKNYTARNIPKKISVTHETDKLIFEVTAKADITPHTDTHTGSWMKVYVCVNDESEMFVINDSPKSESVTTLAKIPSRESLDVTEFVCDIEYKYSKNEIEFTVPVSVFCSNDENFKLWIKSADSKTNYTNPIEFYDCGSSAPVGDLYYTLKIIR